MTFEWDPAKDRANIRKHGIDFDSAKRVFDDPLAVSRIDRETDEETRWQTIGVVGNLTVLLVVSVFRGEEDDETIRIISARKASKHEIRIYEQTA